jgi:hypothetical protein
MIVGYSESEKQAYYNGGSGWQTLGLPRGYRPIHMNNHGDIVGLMVRNGTAIPWLLRGGTPNPIDLPHYTYHHLFPTWINANSNIVGQVSADHGSHAVLWRAR